MTMNSSGPLQFGGTTSGVSIAKELFYSGDQTLSFSDAKFRRLTGQTSGEINLGSAYNKSNEYYAAVLNKNGSVTTAKSEWEGQGTAISADGNTMAAGAPLTGSRTDQYGRNIGSVTVYTRSGESWSQQAIINPPWTGYTIYSNITGTYATYYYGPEIGTALALSSDGNILAIGCHNDNSDGSNKSVGKVCIYTRSGSTWTLQSSIVPTNDYSYQPRFGSSLSMTPDGNTLAIGGFDDYLYVDGQGYGHTRGSVWIYTRNGSTWTKQAKLVPANVVYGYSDACFGGDVSISNDGNTLGVSSFGEYPLAKGAFYVFTRSGSTWTQQQKITYESIWPAGTTGYFFGSKVAVTPDGNTLVTCAPGANSSNGAGALVFTRSNGSWSYRTSLYASGINASGQSQGSNIQIAINPYDSTKYDIFSSVVGYTDTVIKMVQYTGSGATWTETKRITPSAGGEGALKSWGGPYLFGTRTKSIFSAADARTIVIGYDYGSNTHVLMK